MLIYKNEIDAGLGEIIQANASVAYNAAVKLVDKDVEELKARFLQSEAQANPDQFDLFYLESILVSIGWNKNDDVFDKFETWKAKDTPVDKPFNYMHDMADIIGHITSSRVVDYEGNEVSKDLPADDIPDQYDIIVGSVLYKYWPDEDKQQRMNQIISEIQNGKWFVSMECLFKNFDYAVMGPDGQHYVVTRNSETSHLTKHLRIYGGTGEYEGKRIGRLIRNYSYSGKGLVRRPANERSLILDFNHQGVANFIVNNTESKNMPDSTKQETTYTQAQWDELKTELNSLRTKAEEAHSKEVETLKAEIETLTQANEAVAVEKEKVSKRVKDLEAEKAELQEKLEAATKEIEASKLEAVKASRYADLRAINVEETKAKELVDKFASASDELFQELCESYKTLAKMNMDKESYKDKKEMDKEEAKNMKKKVLAEEEEEGTTEAEEAVEESKAEDSTVPNEDNDSTEENLRASASQWFGKIFNTNE